MATIGYPESGMEPQRSLLDDLGEEVTGIVAPVSLCMAVTVLLVRMLNPEGVTSANTVVIASIAYQEQSSDSSGKKFGGALLNAVIFVGVVAGMTVILFLLFKYKCYKFIFAYMGFAVFNIFFFITGALFIQVMQVIDLHIDAFSLAYGLFNFSIVGTIGLLFVPIPLLMKQMYLIWVGIITAYIFTFIPEWTAWVILVFMAIYDIVAVLVPGGPLKALVELAIERQQELPALIYEARPAGGRPYVRGWGRRRQEGEADGEGDGVGYDGDDRGRDGTPNGDRTPQGRGPEPPLPGAAPISPHGQPPPPNGAQQAQMSQRPGSGRPGSGRPVAESALSQQMVVRNSNGAGGDVSTQSGRNGSGGGALEARRSGSQSGAPRLGSWSAATTRIAPDRVGTGPSRMGQSSQSQVPQDSLAMPPTADTTRESEVGENAVWELQQHGSQVAVAGRYTGAGGRPVAEGREDEQWQPLPGSGSGRAPGGISMRARLAGALSASAQPDSPRSSGNSREPLIDGRGRALEQEPGSTPDATPPDMTPTYRGPAGAGPSNPHASRGSASFPVAQVHAGLAEGDHGPKGADPYGYPSKPGRLDDGGTMGVRPVPPAISGDQLAAASRRGAPGTVPPSDPAEPEPAPGAVARERSERLPPDDADYDLPDSIKLGLGDFIFYSMLVGRAAMYDFMTVFSAYLAIIAGLGLTLLCLAVFQKALPALPFSIVLGVLFYFLTRLTLEPFLVPLAGNMAYF